MMGCRSSYSCRIFFLFRNLTTPFPVHYFSSFVYDKK